MNIFKSLSTQELANFFDALYFLKMAELKEVCERLHLPASGVKAELIERIKHFLTTGQVLEESKIPEISKVKKGQVYPLKPETLMLFGSYKNDMQTRAFFKKLVGNHFHFTAFGIDWLKMRWQKGKPPTYQEFADMWQEEIDRRKNKKPEPKKEWALITFVQQYMQEKPNVSQIEVMRAWNKIRAEKVALVNALLKRE